MSNTKKISDNAVTKVQDSFSLCPHIDLKTFTNDTNVSVDGEIAYYNTTSTFSKADFFGKCNIQIKGKTMNEADLGKSSLKFSVDMNDLRYYLKTGSIFYFVVAFNKTMTLYRIYYLILHKYDLMQIFKKDSNNSAKTKRYRFRELPNSVSKKEALVKECIEDSQKQSGHYINLGTSLENFNADHFSFSLPLTFNSTGVAIRDYPIYIYKVLDNNFFIPVGKFDQITKLTRDNTRLNLFINNQLFFKNFPVSITQNIDEVIFELNKGLELKINHTTNKVNVSTNMKCTIAECIYNLKFIENLKNESTITIKLGKDDILVFTVNNFNIPSDGTELKKLEEYYRLCNKLHLKKLTVEEISKEPQLSKNLDLLYSCLFENNTINVSPRNQDKSIGIVRVNIGTSEILCLALQNKTNPAAYKLLDLFDTKVGQFDCKAENGTNTFESCIYTFLKCDDLINTANLCVLNILSAIKKVHYSQDYGISVNTFLLEILKAYDKTQQKDLLKLAEKIAIYLVQNEPKNKYYNINKMQCIKRERDLNLSDYVELGKVINIAEEKDEAILAGISALFNKKDDFYKHLEKIPNPNTREMILTSPIATLIKQEENIKN